MPKATKPRTAGTNSPEEHPVGPKTGTKLDLFLGLRWDLEGYIHVKPPRFSKEYEKMEVRDLKRRIEKDIEELVARTYPTAEEEWGRKFAPAWWQDWGVPHDKRAQVVDEKLAEALRPGLWQRLNTREILMAKEASKELTELLKKRDEKESKRAAESLASLTRKAVTWLENLSVRRPELIREVAKSSALWPVNLGMDKDKSGNPKVTRQTFARKYIERLAVNTECRWPGSDVTGAESLSPFHVAARELYTQLLVKKSEPWQVNFQKQTRWARTLFALEEPMTSRNAEAWWKTAKVWIDEQWDLSTRVETFGPLVLHLHLDNQAYTSSIVKRQVIDDSLKKAFKALAIKVAL